MLYEFKTQTTDETAQLQKILDYAGYNKAF